MEELINSVEALQNSVTELIQSINLDVSGQNLNYDRKLFPSLNLLIKGKLIIIGDSTISSYLGNRSVVDFFEKDNNVNNISVPGNTIQQQLTEYISLSSTIKTEASIVIAQIGLNNLNPAISTATEITALQSLISQIKTSSPSAKIILSTLIPCKARLIALYGSINGLVSYQKWVDINDSIMNRSTLFSNITSVDLRLEYHTIIMNDGSGNLDPLYDDGDGIHPNELGRKIIATSWAMGYNRTIR